MKYRLYGNINYLPSAFRYMFIDEGLIDVQNSFVCLRAVSLVIPHFTCTRLAMSYKFS